MRIAIFTPFVYPFHISMHDLLSSVTESRLYTCGIFGNYPFEKILEKADRLKCIDFLGNKIFHPISLVKLLSNRPHVVIVYGIESIAGMFTYFFSKLIRAKTIVIVEENNRTLFGSKLMNTLRIFKEVLIRKVYASADVLIAESEASRRYICEILRVRRKKPIYVRPHGIDVKPFIRSRNLDKKKAKTIIVKVFELPENIVNKIWLVFIGELSYCKGADVLIDAIELLRKELRNKYVFLLPKRSPLLRDASNLKHVYLRKLARLIKDNIVVLYPPIDVTFMPIFYRATDIVILPSRFLRHTSSDRSPNVAIEAIASQTILVASYAGGIPDIADKVAIFVKPNDSKILAEKLKYALCKYDQLRCFFEPPALIRSIEVLSIESYLVFLIRALYQHNLHTQTELIDFKK